MNKLYILLIGILCLLAYSCVKDDSENLQPVIPQVTVSGFELTYEVYTRQDTLRINPTVPDERNYDFYWTIYASNFNVNLGITPRPDTIARTKDLNYEVLLNPGKYTLILNVRNKNTSVTQLITSSLSVSTLTMTGWYLLKDDGNKTDFDFIHSKGRIDNWMANFNNGKSMEGKAIKCVFASDFKSSLTSTELFNTFMVISEGDAGIFRLDNGKMVMGFDNMFFSKPAVRKPQNILQPVSSNFLNLINDGKIYSLSKGALFANPPTSTYKISPVAGIAANGILFDENSKSVIGFNSVSFNTLNANSTILKNMDAEPVWIGAYALLRGVALELFRKTSGEGFLVKLNATYGPLAGLSDVIIDSKTVPQTHGIMSADVIGGNYDSDYIYYAKANKIYMTDFASLPESLQVTLPEGEQVTCIQHIKYPQPAANVVITTDYLAIASYANGKYKVYLHRISSTGTIQQLAQPDFEGQGRVSGVNYVEQGIGNRTY